MVLTEKETGVIKDLQTQEQSCIQKYQKYAGEAKDPVLVSLFNDLEKDERKEFFSNLLENNNEFNPFYKIVRVEEQEKEREI